MGQTTFALIVAALVLTAVGMTVATAYTIYVHFREPAIEADT